MRSSSLKLVTMLAIISLPRLVAALPPTCSQIDSDLIVDGTNFGHLNGCLCSSDISSFIATDPIAIKAVAATNQNDVYLAVHSLVFYTPSNPNVASCPPNSAPSQRKRSPAQPARANHQCEFGLTKCGVYSGIPFSSPSSPTESEPGYSPVSAYECIDTMFNLESCGGCVVQYTLGLTPYEIDELAVGIDCTANPGVSDVECRMGRCIVHKCKKGYRRSAVLQDNGDALFDCVPMKKTTIVDSLHKQIGGVLHWRGD